MVGRLSTYAKNRILNLRFQNNSKIKHIAQTLLQEDNIKVSRESISTFLKKYIDTKSIHDRPRSGRNKKLTPEEINLIGEITRLNRDITAPKIKQYLNLNVSTHTILRASKLFEWNKHNPNSNEAKKAAALERQLKGEVKKRSKSSKSIKTVTQHESNYTEQPFNGHYEQQKIDQDQYVDQTQPLIHYENQQQTSNEKLGDQYNLNLIDEKELMSMKNLSSSPMVFSTKILMKLFRPDELHGHNVSGKTFSKNVKNKKALDEKRINYIRWLVDNNFETNNREQLWKMCRTAINKIILISEKKSLKQKERRHNESELEAHSSEENKTITMIHLNEFPQCSMSSDHDSENDDGENDSTNETDELSDAKMSEGKEKNETKITTIVKLNDPGDELLIEENNPNNKKKSESRTSRVCKKQNKKQAFTALSSGSSSTSSSSTALSTNLASDENQDDEQSSLVLDSSYDLNLLSEKDILLIKNLYCSPMIFSTKVLTKLFSEDELRGHNLSSKSTGAFSQTYGYKPALDEKRLNYIRWLVEKYFDTYKNKTQLWKSCRKAMCRVLRNIDKKSVSTNSESDQLGDQETEKDVDEPMESSTNNEQEQKRTVVVLIDDPEQEQQMLLS
jgi:hypothetical protein